jgi:hypothetical protein
MQIQALPRPASGVTVRFLGLILALVLAGGLASATNVRAAEVEHALQLTYTKWFTSATDMTGVVGGDIVGDFRGKLLQPVTVSDDGFLLLDAQYQVFVDHQTSPLFTAHVTGKQNIGTGKGVLQGVVTSGWQAGERVLAKFQQKASCPEIHLSGSPCFQGTIKVMGGATDHETS